jgi:hypothetical protein
MFLDTGLDADHWPLRIIHDLSALIGTLQDCEGLSGMDWSEESSLVHQILLRWISWLAYGSPEAFADFSVASWTKQRT